MASQIRISPDQMRESELQNRNAGFGEPKRQNNLHH